MTDMVKTRSALDIAGKRLRIETLAVKKEATEFEGKKWRKHPTGEI